MKTRKSPTSLIFISLVIAIVIFLGLISCTKDELKPTYTVRVDSITAPSNPIPR